MRKTVTDFVPQGGRHCITGALKQIFAFYGIDMTEAMMLGLGSGLSFLYLNQAASPMVNGRCKIFEFEEKLAKRMHIDIKCKSSANYELVLKRSKEMINHDQPILIYVDMPYLKYLGMDENSHFGGHAVVLFGYDDEKQEFFISDRDNHDFSIRTPFGSVQEDYHLVSYEELKQARTSTHRPFPAKNKYLEINMEGYEKPGKAVLCEAIKETCDGMINPPAKLLGLNGIQKFSKEILKWKSFSKSKLTLAGITNYFQISKDGGTGGGIFRTMYGEFLIEASSILEVKEAQEIGLGYIKMGKKWDELADLMWELSLSQNIELLPTMSKMIEGLYQEEARLLGRLAEVIDQIEGNRV